MKKHQAQTIIEYSIVLGLVVSVFVAMQVYLKRGIQSGIKISADQLGKQADGLPFTNAREGQVLNSDSTTVSPSPIQKELRVDGESQVLDTWEVKDTAGLGTSARMDDGWYYIDETLYGGNRSLYRKKD